MMCVVGCLCATEPRLYQIGGDTHAHAVGVTAVSLSLAVPPRALVSAQGPIEPVKRLVSRGYDNLIKVLPTPRNFSGIQYIL
jgi:hypothetical protein